MSTPPNLSVIKAFKILMAFSGSDDNGLKLGDVSSIVDMPVPTAHRFLRTLVSVGALEVEQNGNYRLGTAIKQLSSSALSHFDINGVLSYHAQQLTYILNETVHVAVLRGDMARYVVKAESSRSLQLASKEGTELEAYCTGVGKVLLANVGNDRMLKYINTDNFVPLTPKTIVDRTELLAELKRIQERGYAHDNEEFEQGLRCIAVPVVTDDRVYALSVSGPTSRIMEDDVPKVAKELIRRSKLIEAEIGGGQL